jgi:hypothetical protein
VTVVPDDDLVEEPFEEPCDEPSGTCTPPTPEVSPSRALPPPAPPLRQRAMAQLLPVSVPAVIKDMAIPCLQIGFGTIYLVPQLQPTMRVLAWGSN